ncbi:putative alkaline-phosphatase-like, core domain superfamily [Helianthus anomalus]
MNLILDANILLQKVVEVLQNQSDKGGLHENTLLLVMGDHGQTVNDDHGGGSPEEVETSIFAMHLKKPSFPVPSEYDTSSCKLDLVRRHINYKVFSLILLLIIFVSITITFSTAVATSMIIFLSYSQDRRKVCVSSIDQQRCRHCLESRFLLEVNPMLYALVTGTWNLESYDMSSSHSQLKMEEWMHNYAKVLCVNSWQVKKYIDVYTDSSVIGFSINDLKHVQEMYSQAVNWSTNSLHDDVSSFDALKKQIDLYSDFLASVAELSRTKFTEFDLRMG